MPVSRTDESSPTAPTPGSFLNGSSGLVRDAASSFISDPGKRALQRLVSHAVPQGELPTVVETIVSNMKAADIVECVEEGNAQAFIDAMDQACCHPIPSLGICFTDIYISTLFPLIRRWITSISHRESGGNARNRYTRRAPVTLCFQGRCISNYQRLPWMPPCTGVGLETCSNFNIVAGRSQSRFCGHATPPARSRWPTCVTGGFSSLANAD